jgi:hypothetical protein
MRGLSFSSAARLKPRSPSSTGQPKHVPSIDARGASRRGADTSDLDASDPGLDDERSDLERFEAASSDSGDM